MRVYYNKMLLTFLSLSPAACLEMCLQSFNRIISVKSIHRSITSKHSEKYYYSHYPGVWRHRDLSCHLSNACHIIQSSKVYWLSISSVPVKPRLFFPLKNIWLCTQLCVPCPSSSSLACSPAPSPEVEAQGSFCSWKGHKCS